jgi:hypothetical protein
MYLPLDELYPLPLDEHHPLLVHFSFLMEINTLKYF